MALSDLCPEVDPRTHFDTGVLGPSTYGSPPGSVAVEHRLSGLAGFGRGSCWKRKTLSYYLTKIARLGGYLPRASDPPPGNTVMWRGLSRQTDIALGARVVGAEIVGN